VTVEALEALLDPQGEYALAQGRIFFQRREELYLNVRMPFEVPAGQQDDATNMLAFRLKHPKLPRLEKLLEPPKGQRVEVEGDRGVWVNKSSDELVTWFMRNPHAADELLIWPHWAEAPFLQTARETYSVAERLRERSGARLLWNGEPCTPKQMEWLRRYPHLLAVELMQWLESKWEPAARGGDASSTSGLTRRSPSTPPPRRPRAPGGLLAPDGEARRRKPPACRRQGPGSLVLSDCWDAAMDLTLAPLRAQVRRAA